MTLEEALAALQPPPGHNTLITKEAIDLVCNAARAYDRETVARWMMEHSYATGHGDTIADLLVELEGQARSRAAPAVAQDGESETRKLTDPFTGQEVEISDNLIDRLRGKYACGPTLPNGEPEFGWRQMPTIPIQIEAATEIARLLQERDYYRKDAATFELEASRAEADANRLAGALQTLINSALLLHQNAIGCAIKHQGLDIEREGQPGWLRDCGADIYAARTILAEHAKGGDK